MKQKSVIKILMKCEKTRVKVMKIVAEARGVISMKIDGVEKDRVVVIGNDVDVTELINSLRKKVGYATIISVKNMKDEEDDDESEGCSRYASSSSSSSGYGYGYGRPGYSSICPTYYYGVAHQDPYPTNSCSHL